ncbi:hypothetical protein NP233_g7838 [Leucocoprinus birnbaumii]|uniref:Nephrocystin 3-like N-terminal domain-containing protein n=1 Tax=Leucocoprinus birnbaumii TaxID=56174 RepID=A0AAD5VNI6_9AGAR|nr:hypothetical protein NP233_g7838 [Leucocoprinus birnbaumii]
MPDASHDSAARSPPPKCHPGTCRGFIKQIVDWGSGTFDYTEPILWIRGPFGVGKSTLAQSGAELLELKRMLVASLFLSRLNKRGDPKRIFPSVAYQLAMQSPSFCEVISFRIRDDPSIFTKSLSRQFDELLVQPLRQIGPRLAELVGRVVIIDGLDECEGAIQQCNVIDLITESVANRTTPFRWLITSRPEGHIIRSMESEGISPYLTSIELSVHHKFNRSILVYIRDELKVVGQRHNLASSWPPGDDLVRLTELAAGLFAHAATIVRFIGNTNSLGPNDQLRSVLEFADGVQSKVGAPNPLVEMDMVYTLLMQQVPSNISPVVRKILLVGSVLSSGEVMWLPAIANVLGLSEEQVRMACGTLQSILSITEDRKIVFYHFSFMSFMKEPEKSKELCLYGDCLIQLRRELTERLQEVHSRGSESMSPVIDITFPVRREHANNSAFVYHRLLLTLVQLWQLPNKPIDPQTALAMKDIQFHLIPHLLRSTPQVLYIKPLELRNNIPTEFRDRILRRSRNPVHLLTKPKFARPEMPYMLGCGKNQLIFWSLDGEVFMAEGVARDGGCNYSDIPF